MRFQGAVNQCETSVYEDLTTKCKNKDFWGVDCNGTPLSGTKLRHHRFPLSEKCKETLNNKNSTTYYYTLLILH